MKGDKGENKGIIHYNQAFTDVGFQRIEIYIHKQTNKKETNP